MADPAQTPLAATPSALQRMGIGLPTLGVQFTQAQGERAAAARDIEKSKAKYEASMTPLREKMAAAAKAGEDLPLPEIPPLPDKFRHQGILDQPEQLASTMRTMFAFAALGGAMTRQPVTTALNAFNASMKGMMQGDQMTFERESKTFDDNLKLAIDKSNQAIAKYNLAYQRNRGNMQALMDQANLINSEFQFTTAQAHVDKSDARALENTILALQKSADQMEHYRLIYQAQMGRTAQSARKVAVASTTDVKNALALIQNDSRTEKMSADGQNALAAAVASRAKRAMLTGEADDFNEGMDVAMQELIDAGKLHPVGKMPFYRPDQAATFDPASGRKTPPPATAAAPQVSLADWEHTKQVNGLTDEQLEQKLGIPKPEK